MLLPCCRLAQTWALTWKARGPGSLVSILPLKQTGYYYYLLLCFVTTIEVLDVFYHFLWRHNLDIALPSRAFSLPCTRKGSGFGGCFQMKSGSDISPHVFSVPAGHFMSNQSFYSISGKHTFMRQISCLWKEKCSFEWAPLQWPSQGLK